MLDVGIEVELHAHGGGQPVLIGQRAPGSTRDRRPTPGAFPVGGSDSARPGRGSVPNPPKRVKLWGRLSVSFPPSCPARRRRERPAGQPHPHRSELFGGPILRHLSAAPCRILCRAGPWVETHGYHQAVATRLGSGASTSPDNTARGWNGGAGGCRRRWGSR